MTWTIYRNMDVCRTKTDPFHIGDVLCECFVQAHRDQRVTTGVMECAKLLRCNPDNVMLCLLPAASGQHDVTLDIQHTLIEAFCWENEIQLFKVDGQDQLVKMLSACEDENNNSEVAMPGCDLKSDVSCLLIEYPKGQMSQEDNLLMDHLNDLVNHDDNAKKVIELPV